MIKTEILILFFITHDAGKLCILNQFAPSKANKALRTKGLLGLNENGKTFEGIGDPALSALVMACFDDTCFSQISRELMVG